MNISYALTIVIVLTLIAIVVSSALDKYISTPVIENPFEIANVIAYIPAILFPSCILIALSSAPSLTTKHILIAIILSILCYHVKLYLSSFSVENIFLTVLSPLIYYFSEFPVLLLAFSLRFRLKYLSVLLLTYFVCLGLFWILGFFLYSSSFQFGYSLANFTAVFLPFNVVSTLLIYYSDKMENNS